MTQDCSLTRYELDVSSAGVHNTNTLSRNPEKLHEPPAELSTPLTWLTKTPSEMDTVTLSTRPS